MGKQSKHQRFTRKQLRQSAYWAIRDAEMRAIRALQFGTWMTEASYELGLKITVAPGGGQGTWYFAQDGSGASSGWTTSPYDLLGWITAQYGWLVGD